MSLTARDVAEILRVLEESSFDTLDLDMDGVQLRLRRSGAPPARDAAAAVAGTGAVAPAEKRSPQDKSSFSPRGVLFPGVSAVCGVMGVQRGEVGKRSADVTSFRCGVG